MGSFLSPNVTLPQFARPQPWISTKGTVPLANGATKSTSTASSVAPKVASASTPATTPVRNTTIAPPGPTTADTAAAQAAAAAADAAAKVNQYKTQVNSKLDAYNNMFGSLYGRIDAAAADQANKTQTAYQGQKDSLTQDYNSQVPQIDMSYYLSGAGDSSFKLGGLGNAEKAFTNSIDKVDQSQNTDLAAIGKEQAGTKGKYGAQQAAIAEARRQAAESDDPTELKSLIAKITDNMMGLQADEANFDTEAGFRGSLAKAAPTQDVAPIRQTLTTLMNGAANPALKQQLASKIIANATVPDSTKKDLTDEFLTGKA